jgi:hypothetical protein
MVGVVSVLALRPRDVLRAALLAAGLTLAIAAAPAAADDVVPLPDVPPSEAPRSAAPLPEAPPPPPAPVITLTSPYDGAAFGAGGSVPLAADAAGAISVVSFHVDGRLKCVDARAPYGCGWSPTAADLGPHVIEARVTDVTGQTASDTARITVGRLIPPSVGATTVRKKLGGGWRLTTTGSVAVPAGLSAAACAGTATVTVLQGSHTIVDRSVPVGSDCRFSSQVRFSARRATSALRVKVAYEGAQLLAPRSAPTQTLRLR